MQFDLYADAQSIEVLRTSDAKALLLGSDFGYGNFGDLLQHMGAASRIRRRGLPVVSVLTLDALSRNADSMTLRNSYSVDAIVFLSASPIAPERANELGLQRVQLLQGIALVQLYGGGFLNRTWGDFVLSAVEYFLDRLPGARYVISGQQVSEGYEVKVSEHVGKYAPVMVGIRDEDSLRRMGAFGVDARFSFDDAVEPLFALGNKLKLCRGEGAFVHLNTSGYTGNDQTLDEMRAHLELVASSIGSSGKAVVLQAFQDAREEVIDSLETIKRLETGFPFSNIETVMLVTSIMREHGGAPRVLEGRFGYSSSYHVTLWLQLAGVPCWLRGSNDYYVQKRKALGIEGSFEKFLEQMTCPDHGRNLDARASWLQRLDEEIDAVGVVRNRIEWAIDDQLGTFRTFNYKGEPRLSERLDEVWKNSQSLNERLIELDRKYKEKDAQSRQTELEFQDRFVALSDQLSQLGAEYHELQRRVAGTDAALAQALAARAEMEAALDSTRERVAAYSEQLTEVGSDARHHRELYAAAQAAYEATSAREQILSKQLGSIFQSRVWRWTRPLRALSRFCRTGRFDVAGTIGAYRALQLMAQRMPVPQGWKSAVGRALTRLRRS